MKKVTCDKFGNRCSICGGFMDQGICPNGHEVGQVYRLPDKENDPISDLMDRGEY